MIFRLIRLSLAAACALAVSHIGSVLAGTVIGTYTNNEVTLTMTYLNTYQITADGANVTVDAYDLSATDSLYPFAGFEFDIGNGNLDGIPSLNSPFQVWDTSGDQTVTKAEASAILSRSNDTYQADTHVMTTFGFTAWDQETNDASFANGPDYQIGVGSLDYAAVDVGGSAGYTVDVANVGIVRGTVVSSQLQTGGTSGPARTFNLTFPSSPLLGDANCDGKVDINDLTVVLANYGQTGATWTQGEFTGDGTVDINDLTIVLTNYGSTLGSSPPAAVPEPSTLLLAAAGLLGALAIARRRREMNHPSWKQPLVTEEPFCRHPCSFATTPWRRRSNGKEPPMTARFTCFSAAVICALVVSLLGGTAAAGIVVNTYSSSGVTLTMTYLETYNLTDEGADVLVDAYDLSATDSQYAIVAYEFDIGNGNTAGIPSVNSPCQVWGASGNQTITGTEAHSVLSKTNGTYYADTHVNTTIGFVVADTETNDASFADGPNYQIGVGSLDYTCASLFGSTTYTIDVANVGIVEGTDVSGELQIGGTSGPTATFDMTFPSVAPTPEPSTLALMAMGLAGLVAYAWRKRRREGFLSEAAIAAVSQSPHRLST